MNIWLIFSLISSALPSTVPKDGISVLFHFKNHLLHFSVHVHWDRIRGINIYRLPVKKKATKSDSCFTSSPHYIAVQIQRTWEADHGTGCPLLPLQGGASVVDCLIRCYIHPSLDDLVLLNLIFCQLCFISNAQVRNWKHTAGQLARASVTCGWR